MCKPEKDTSPPIAELLDQPGFHAFIQSAGKFNLIATCHALQQRKCELIRRQGNYFKKFTCFAADCGKLQRDYLPYSVRYFKIVRQVVDIISGFIARYVPRVHT